MESSPFSLLTLLPQAYPVAIEYLMFEAFVNCKNVKPRVSIFVSHEKNIYANPVSKTIIPILLDEYYYG